MIVFRHPAIGVHMNVIFGQVGRTLWAMEPYHPYPGESGTRSSAQLVRSVDFYICASDDITPIQPTVTLLGGRSTPRA
jgi:hypothetical protein